jgi:hypothetical protein
MPKKSQINEYSDHSLSPDSHGLTGDECHKFDVLDVLEQVGSGDPGRCNPTWGRESLAPKMGDSLSPCFSGPLN